MRLRITIHLISIDGLWGSLTPKLKTADFTPFLWITKEDFRFGWYKAMSLGFSHGSSTDADEAKATKGPFFVATSCTRRDMIEGSSLCFWRCQSWPEEHCPCSHRAAWHLPARCPGRWLGPMSVNCKSHFHGTVMKKSLVNPFFKGWGERNKCKIKIQTSLSLCTSLKPVFPIHQTTLHNGVQCRWTPQPGTFPLNATEAHS